MTDEGELAGTGVTPLVGVGHAYWLETSVELGPPPDPDDVDADVERDRFERTRDAVREALEREREAIAERVGDEEADIFDAHAAFLMDPQIADGVTAAIEDGLPATHAVRETFDEHVDQFEGLEGPMAERADDLRDVRDRLLRRLLADEADAGDAATDGTAAAEDPEPSIPGGAVVLADRLTPSETAAFDPDRIAGIATSTGGETSHAAIITRALGIPAVVGVGDVLRTVSDGTPVVVDGDRGVVVPDPDDETRERAAADRTAEPIPEPVSTSDGRSIEVAANVAGPADFDRAVAMGADGVGLFRTEFLFFDRDEPPDEDEQFRTYREALETVSGRVIVRTLDVGGDKPLPYRQDGTERNPFLGARGIRLSLEEQSDLFETQLRALLRAAATPNGDDLAVMFPMITTVEELDAARERLHAIAEDLTAAGVDNAVPELGVMIETPAAAFVADELAARVDFLSLGTNDLTQYVMAADRENERVADLQDPLSPPVLRAIARTVRAGHEGGAWVGMCGELAGDPAVTELLVGLGLDELSASPIAVPAVKRQVQDLDANAATDLADRVLDAATREEVRARYEDESR
ncbi:phosphoenolpyruvate--protein phosphotransferase [Halosolutus halophilus]|uniref:phosphoenolpyruvate--protein phosphotransferase n=1 Tax=Halosolutus halophilus TaxID=1552990 RepID=UPI0022350F69|nr:phosphoenolpyruvate--protein phosphotransferase [Halosolutus halophilus]